MKKKYKRKFNLNRIRGGQSYSIQEISELLDVHKRTALEWIKKGLKRIDNSKPYMIHASDLKDFLSNKQGLNKAKCKFNELYCMKCKNPNIPYDNEIELKFIDAKRSNMVGLCSVCTSLMHKLVSNQNIEKMYKTFKVSEQNKEHLIECLKASENTHFKGGQAR